MLKLRYLLRRIGHLFFVLAALLAASTLIGMAVGLAFWIGGTSWEQSVTFARYMQTTLACPAALLWLMNAFRGLGRAMA